MGADDGLRRRGRRDDDLDAFGNEGRGLGFQGSISARATATSGNDETTGTGTGARLGSFVGLNGSELTLAFTFTGDRDGFDPVSSAGVPASQTDLVLSCDHARGLGRDFPAFAEGLAVHDGNEGEREDDEVSGNREDIFVDAGDRIPDTVRLRLWVRAGPGYRWLEDLDGGRIEEEAISLSSDRLYQCAPTVAVSDDTDVIASEKATTDLALVVSHDESASPRTSLFTEHDSKPGTDDVGRDAEDVVNAVGAAVVHSFRPSAIGLSERRGQGAQPRPSAWAGAGPWARKPPRRRLATGRYCIAPPRRVWLGLGAALVSHPWPALRGTSAGPQHKGICRCVASSPPPPSPPSCRSRPWPRAPRSSWGPRITATWKTSPRAATSSTPRAAS